MTALLQKKNIIFATYEIYFLSKSLENITLKTFLIGGKIMLSMHKLFDIETIIENGHGHYKVTDNRNGNVIHCEFSELNETIYELLGWR